MIRYTDEGMYYGTRYCEMKTNVWGCDSGDMTLRPLHPVSLEHYHISPQYPSNIFREELGDEDVPVRGPGGQFEPGLSCFEPSL